MKITYCLLAAVLTTLPLSSSQCPCIDVPESDAVSPRVALWINGVERVNTEELSSPVTLNIPAEESFKTMLHSSDQGGIKETVLIWKYYVDMGGIQQLVQPMLVPTDWSDCANKVRIEQDTFDWGNQNRTYKMSAKATDFHGNTSTTPVITIVHSH